MTSIRCGGFQPKIPKEEDVEASNAEGARRKEEPQLVEIEHAGENSVAVNATALKPLVGYQLEFDQLI